MADLSPELLLRLFRYDPETGKLFWRNRTPDLFADGKHSAEHNCRVWNSGWAGKEAFTGIGNHGYRAGSIFDRKYLAHRVIWAITHGAWPCGQIDHINGVRDDNHIENLRAVSDAENKRNKKRYGTNTSGVVGVCWHKATGKWQARIAVGGERKHLGLFTSKDDAITARAAAEVEHGYHENHGREK